MDAYGRRPRVPPWTTAEKYDNPRGRRGHGETWRLKPPGHVDSDPQGHRPRPQGRRTKQRHGGRREKFAPGIEASERQEIDQRERYRGDKDELRGRQWRQMLVGRTKMLVAMTSVIVSRIAINVNGNSFLTVGVTVIDAKHANRHPEH